MTGPVAADVARSPRRIPANACIGAVLVGLVVVLALLALVWTPYDPLLPDFRARLAPPSSDHWLGTDQYGRDVLSRIMSAASVSVMIAFGTVFVALAVGVAVGSLAAYFGGWADRLAGVVLDAMLAFPAILLALFIMTVLGPSTTGVMLALGIAFAPTIARVVRSTVLGLRQREFIEASLALGNGHLFTLARHILPNCVSPLIVISTSLLALAILLESALSFLGLGVPPPAPTWGGMLADSRQFVGGAPWLAVFPGLAISLALLGVNLLGDALRDRLDPRMNNT